MVQALYFTIVRIKHKYRFNAIFVIDWSQDYLIRIILLDQQRQIVPYKKAVHESYRLVTGRRIIVSE